jgi:acetolactate synthase I/II/III large subunit
MYQASDDTTSAAELMVRCLENDGVTVVFGLPGEENIQLTQALERSSIRYVLTRHEQAASFMAEMYGRVTGSAGVVSATLGPGAINLQLGVADAMTNSTPLVAISAQVGHDRNYKESHQFVDLVRLFEPITKWSGSVPAPQAVPEMIRKAFKTAETERPGAVYLAVPEDVDDAQAGAELQPLPRNVVRPEAPSPAQVKRAADLIRQATRPIVLAGHGAARGRASKALDAFATGLGVPVATTFHGKGVFPDDHPHSVGTIGFMARDYVTIREEEITGETVWTFTSVSRARLKSRPILEGCLSGSKIMMSSASIRPKNERTKTKATVKFRSCPGEMKDAQTTQPIRANSHTEWLSLSRPPVARL